MPGTESAYMPPQHTLHAARGLGGFKSLGAALEPIVQKA
jgi:hypothetical protein